MPELAALVKVFAGGVQLTRAYVGDVLVALTRTNLCTNPIFETNTAGFVADGSTLARVTTQYHSPTASLQVTPSVAAGGASYDLPTTAGQVYTISAWFMSPVTRDAQIFASAGAGSGVHSLPAGVWTRLRVTFAATAASTTVYFSSQSTTGVFYLDDVLMEQTPDLGVEFSGATPAGIGHGPGAWTGAANASTSKMWGMPTS